MARKLDQIVIQLTDLSTGEVGIKRILGQQYEDKSTDPDTPFYQVKKNRADLSNGDKAKLDNLVSVVQTLIDA